MMMKGSTRPNVIVSWQNKIEFWDLTSSDLGMCHSSTRHASMTGLSRAQ
jgi:hypothetical protein